MKRKCQLAVLCIAVVLSMMGCAGPEPTEKPTAPVSGGNTLRQNNQVIALAELDNSVFPTADGAAFYLVSRVISYYDPTLDTSFPACPIAGCSHKDDTCPARIGGMEGFCADENGWYAFCREPDELVLQRIDPHTGKRETLHTWQKDVYFSSGLLSGGWIVACFSQNAQEGSHSTGFFAAVDLRSGTVTEFARNDARGSGALVAASGNSVILEWNAYTQPMLTSQQWQEQHPEQDGDGYYAYLNDFTSKYAVHSFRRYDLTTGTFTDIPNTEDARQFTDPNAGFDDYYIYRQGDSVMLGTVSGGEGKAVLTCRGLLNAWLMDGRIFALHTEDGELVESVVTLATGEISVLHNYGDGGSVTFSATGETRDYFAGLYQGRRAVISKADYYAGNFERAIFY